MLIRYPRSFEDGVMGVIDTDADTAWDAVPGDDTVVGEVRAPDAQDLEAVAMFQAQTEAVAAQEQKAADDEALRVAMFDLTEDIIAWSTAAQQYLGSSGAQGALNPQAFMGLLSQARDLLLDVKNNVNPPQAVLDQRDWMLQRGQEAQSIVAIAALMK